MCQIKMEPDSFIWIRLFIWYFGDAPCKPKSNLGALFIIHLYILSKVSKQQPQVSTPLKLTVLVGKSELLYFSSIFICTMTYKGRFGGEDLLRRGSCASPLWGSSSESELPVATRGVTCLA
jgi:hypothetical protein